MNETQQQNKTTDNRQTRKPKKRNYPQKQRDKLKVIPIGGLGEIGKNMTVFEYKDEIIIVDCGLKFPDDEMYGIDIVLPDFSYLIE
ncbi:MAG: ribonuclease J, partial [Eubacterium sp.]